MDGAAVATVHLDGALRGVGAIVFGGFHAAVAHLVDFEGLRLACVDGAALYSPSPTPLFLPSGLCSWLLSSLHFPLPRFLRKYFLMPLP